MPYGISKEKYWLFKTDIPLIQKNWESAGLLVQQWKQATEKKNSGENIIYILHDYINKSFLMLVRSMIKKEYNF